MDSRFKVIDGRTGSLGITTAADDAPVSDALASLAALYARNTRHCRYDDVSATPFETLHYKTGWVYLGKLVLPPGSFPGQVLEWTTEGPGFDFADGRDSAHAIPKLKDRIRLKESQGLTILDYCASGEERRNVSPLTQSDSLGLKDSTGRYAEAGRVYRVADVQIESGNQLTDGLGEAGRRTLSDARRNRVSEASRGGYNGRQEDL